jgi:hypothetical protein
MVGQRPGIEGISIQRVMAAQACRRNLGSCSGSAETQSVKQAYPESIHKGVQTKITNYVPM